MNRLPIAVANKAVWYVLHQETHVRVCETDDGDYVYYILRKDNGYGAKRLTTEMIDKYEETHDGKKPRGTRHVPKLCSCYVP